MAYDDTIIVEAVRYHMAYDDTIIVEAVRYHMAYDDTIIVEAVRYHMAQNDIIIVEAIRYHMAYDDRVISTSIQELKVNGWSVIPTTANMTKATIITHRISSDRPSQPRLISSYMTEQEHMQ
jgi:hypothetical protein